VGIGLEVASTEGEGMVAVADGNIVFDASTWDGRIVGVGIVSV
jgi:hypothetical protein